MNDESQDTNGERQWEYGDIQPDALSVDADSFGEFLPLLRQPGTSSLEISASRLIICVDEARLELTAADGTIKIREIDGSPGDGDD